MFSLIVTIVSIALVAALAVATLYYGSDAAAQGRTAARAAAIVSAGEQVAAGLSLYRLNTGMWPATLETLVTESYLNGLPEVAAADSLSFIASAHAAPAIEGDWIYDPETPHLAYIRPISMEVCAEVNRRINGRRMVLSVLDPGIKIQCAAGSGDPVVVFRNSEVPLTTPPAVPGAPTVGSGGEFGEVGRVIDTEGEDTSGRCVYACEPGGSGGGGSAGGGNGGGTGGDGGGGTEPTTPPPQAPVTPEPSHSDWVPEGSGYCSPEVADEGYASIEFSEVVAQKTMRVVVTGERYVSSEAGDDVLYVGLSWDTGDDFGWDGLEFSGVGEGWVPFTYSTMVPAGASIIVTGDYNKGSSGAAGEDRACLRGVTLSFEATAETEPDAPAQIAFEPNQSIGDFNAYECTQPDPSAQMVDYCNSVPLQGESGLPVFFSGLGDYSADYSSRVLTCEPFHQLPMTLNGTTFGPAQIEDLVGITFTASLTQLYVPPAQNLEPPLQAPTANRYLYLAVYNGSNWDIASGSGPVSTTYQSGVTYNEDGTPVVGDLGLCGYNDGSGLEYWGAYRLSLTASRGSDSSSATAYIVPGAN